MPDVPIEIAGLLGVALFAVGLWIGYCAGETLARREGDDNGD